MFKKVKPKAKLLKMKGSIYIYIYNNPVTKADVNCDILPRPAHSNRLPIVKT